MGSARTAGHDHEATPLRHRDSGTVAAVLLGDEVQVCDLDLLGALACHSERAEGSLE